MLTQAIKDQFHNLKLCGERIGISQEKKRAADLACLEYLQSLLNSDELNAEDKCFCYWNISDQYALLRNREALYENHKLFYGYLKSLPVKYLYWAVCDGTQRGVLEEVDADFWWNIYHEANEKNRLLIDCEAIAFTAHRAAFAISSNSKRNDVNILYAKSEFESFLEKTKNSSNHAFYMLIYHAEHLHAFERCEYDLESLCEEMLPKLALPRMNRKYEIGEWNDFIADNNDACRQARVGICAAVNALIYTGHIHRAEKIYHSAIDCGLPRNQYIEKRM